MKNIVEETMENCGITEPLQVGSKFQQAFPGSWGLIFEILAIKPEENWCRVLVTDPTNHYQNEEEWDDLHNVYQSLSIGDYKKLTSYY